MISLQFDRAKWQEDSDGVWLSLRVKLPHLAKKFVASIKDRLYVAEVKEYREKRSLDANGYLWKLCDEIARVVKNITKEVVYMDAVRHAGQFEMLVIKDVAIDNFVHKWSGHGLGWFAEKIDGNTAGYTQVIAYYGSSVYDTKEMSFLIDYVVNLAKDLDINTATPEELARMKSEWNQ